MYVRNTLLQVDARNSGMFVVPDVCILAAELHLVHLVAGQHPAPALAKERIHSRTLPTLCKKAGNSQDPSSSVQHPPSLPPYMYPSVLAFWKTQDIQDVSSDKKRTFSPMHLMPLSGATISKVSPLGLRQGAKGRYTQEYMLTAKAVTFSSLSKLPFGSSAACTVPSKLLRISQNHDADDIPYATSSWQKTL